MRTRNVLCCIFLTLLLVANPGYAKAASGLPNSPEFGYGASISTCGQQISQALAFAPEIGLDWIAVNFDWARVWSDPNAEPDLSALKGVIENAQQSNINILASVSNSPAWAMTPTGPNVDAATTLTLKIASSFQKTQLVVELFPGANTVRGWGTTPNPEAYIEMIQKARNAIVNQNLQAYVIPSLSPVSGAADTGNIDDITFLRKFYEGGLATPIVGLRYQEVTGQPFSEPMTGGSGVLRHYEAVRNLMLQNNHRTDLIWITGFSWPSQLASAEEQASWIYEAYKLLKAQLYIGAAFFDNLNPASPEETFYFPASLVLADGSLHPAAAQIRKITARTGESIETSQVVPQTQKGIIKKHNHKTIFKRPSS